MGHTRYHKFFSSSLTDNGEQRKKNKKSVLSNNDMSKRNKMKEQDRGNVHCDDSQGDLWTCEPYCHSAHYLESTNMIGSESESWW